MLLKLIELRFHTSSLTAPSEALVKDKGQRLGTLFNDVHKLVCE